MTDSLSTEVDQFDPTHWTPKGMTPSRVTSTGYQIFACSAAPRSMNDFNMLPNAQSIQGPIGHITDEPWTPLRAIAPPFGAGNDREMNVNRETSTVDTSIGGSGDIDGSHAAGG